MILQAQNFWMVFSALKIHQKLRNSKKCKSSKNQKLEEMSNEIADYPFPPHYYKLFETPESIAPPNLREVV